MTRDEAKLLLARARDPERDEADPELQTALEMARHDLELGQWLEKQRALNRKAIHIFRETPDAAHIRDQILSSSRLVPMWRRREFLAAAASVALLGAVGALTVGRRKNEEETLAAWRVRMLRFAIREYRMDILTTDETRVREFLRGHGDGSHYELPGLLAARTLKGAARLTWQGAPVSMVCFQGTGNETLYLFVLGRKAIKTGEIPGTNPEAFEFGGLNSTCWARGDKIYLLAGRDAAELQKLAG
jgi:hypothetical protein